MTVAHDTDIIEFVKTNSSEPIENIIASFEEQGFDMSDIFDSTISDELLEMAQSGDSRFERCAKVVSAIRKSFRKKEEKAIGAERKSNSSYKIHSLDAFKYRAHNELKIEHSAVSHALL
jgi:hypothetical protein